MNLQRAPFETVFVNAKMQKALILLLFLTVFLLGCGVSPSVSSTPTSDKQDSSATNMISSPSSSNKAEKLSAVTPPSTTANIQLIPIGKKVQEIASIESGKKVIQDISLLDSIAVPIPNDIDIKKTIIKPTNLIVDEKTINYGETLPVFIYTIVSTQYFENPSAENIIVRFENIAFRLEETNELLLDQYVEDTNGSSLFLMITVDTEAIKQFSQYYIEIPLYPNTDKSIMFSALSIPTYEYQWKTINGDIAIEFQ